MSVIALAGLVGLIVGAALVRIVYPVESSGARSGSHPASPPPVAAGLFAGTWHFHTSSVALQADGSGVADWPTHVVCGSGPFQGPPPCDQFIPTTVTSPNGAPFSEEEIVDGGHALLRLTSVASSIAHGVVESSTESSVLPDGPITIRVTKDDLLLITTSKPSVYGAKPLCGSEAAALSISQQNARGINCGA